MPLLKRKRVLAAKVETTSGTAESLTAAEGVFNIYDPEIQADIEAIERRGQSAFSSLAAITGLRGGSLTFKTDIHGDGAGGVPAWASVLLPGCGWVNTTGTFSPVTAAPGSSVKTLTMGVYEDGLKKLLRGAAGTFKIMLETGKPAMIEWTFTGVWQAVTDVAILAPTYPTNLPLRFANSTFTIASWAPCVQSAEIDAGNEVILRECQTAADASGYAGALITNRSVTGTVNPEASLVATEDPYGDWIAHNQQALSIVLADAADTITLASPKLQYTNIQEGDRSGIQVDDITFQCNRSAAAGDDEFTFTFAAT